MKQLMKIDISQAFAGLKAGDRASLGKAITLVESLNPKHRAQADALLDMSLQERPSSFRFAVSGAPGVGKSTVGKEIAKRLNYNFLDVDELIEKKTGTKLQKIIDEQGDWEFLEIEKEVVLGLGQLDNHIISPGGSIVYVPESMEFLKKNHSAVSTGCFIA